MISIGHTFVISCLVVTTLSAFGQSRKAGLWNIATTTTMEKPRSGVGVLSKSEAGLSSDGNQEALAICLSQTVIDTYGILLPPSLRDCQLSNVVRMPMRMSADLSCMGRTNGKGSMETRWIDSDHATAVVHFTDRTKGRTPRTLAWTEEATAVFKSTDCGAVKARVMPDPRR